jgi:hypothetical protein
MYLIHAMLGVWTAHADVCVHGSLINEPGPLHANAIAGRAHAAPHMC